MTRHLPKLFLFLFIIISHHTYSQNEFFHEIILEKTLLENEEWEFVGEANWKNLYAEPGWRRWGASFAGTRKINRFSLSAGANGFYTFNKRIINFFEMRPWTSLQLRLPIVADITFRQRLKYEWRFFYTEEDNTTRENYRRLRCQIGFDIPLTSEHESSWKIRPFFEWFFIRNPTTFERFPNERDYGLTFIKSLKNEHELSFSYRIEEFFNLDTEREYGHTILVAYSF